MRYNDGACDHAWAHWEKPSKASPDFVYSCYTGKALHGHGSSCHLSDAGFPDTQNAGVKITGFYPDSR